MQKRRYKENVEPPEDYAALIYMIHDPITVAMVFPAKGTVVIVKVRVV